MTLWDKFWEFDSANPHVYRRLAELASQWVERWGYPRRVGIELFFAVIRWEEAMKTADPHSDFKLNDHYTSRYARVLLRNHPEWDGLFELRQLKRT